MKSETPSHTVLAVPTDHPASVQLPPAPPLPLLFPPSRIRLSSSHRGARLARLLVAQQLDEWGIPRTTSTGAVIVAVVAELAANAGAP
ncbi:hypothetical protein [Streptomyces sp. AK02-01A]|uniref:hypothetical protein n=1 Tax=Streptomyces sp. AK02-01A TaxID=3028648 RepID=UPI0029A1D6AA|nr:hypothetical protein [Streptomyces sp. AK02-01A]MDX3852034.1 hypothetical protein [Streptomyces sp. AK02-01A]